MYIYVLYNIHNAYLRRWVLIKPEWETRPLTQLDGYKVIEAEQYVPFDVNIKILIH